MRQQIAFLLFVCLLRLFCHAETPRFVALEQYEERNKVMQLRKMMEEELISRENRDKRIAAMEARLINIARERSLELRLMEYLKLRRRARDLNAELKSSNDRQLEIAGMIDASMASASQLPQVTAYLMDARSQLRTLGIVQNNERKRLEQLMNGIRIAIRNIPAPKEYDTAGGVHMVLVQAGGMSFYVSKEPLRKGDVNLKEAAEIVNVISSAEGAKYRLPELKELKLMGQSKIQLECAVWSGSRFEGKDIEDERTMDRFGVRKYIVWDNAKMLGRGTQFPELPNAKYPTLGCYVVTDVRTGWNKRWNAVLTKLGGDAEVDK